MKTKLFLMLTIVVCALASCSTDDDDKVKNHSGKLQSFNDLDFFRSSIAWKDSLGNIQRHYGEVLYESEPQNLYVGVDSYEEAEAIFLGWIAPGGDIARDVSGRGWVYNMTDEDGHSQGSVTFTPSAASGYVAEVKASAQVNFELFSNITFILSSVWPYNSEESKYQLGDIVKINGQNGVCIREARKGVKGMILGITKNEYSGGYDGMMEATVIGYGIHNKDWVNKYCPNKEEAVAIAKMLSESWDFYQDCFDDAGEGELRRGWDYWTEEWDWKAVYDRRWAMVLSVPNTDGLEWFDVDWNNPVKRVLLRETF